MLQQLHVTSEMTVFHLNQQKIIQNGQFHQMKVNHGPVLEILIEW